MGREDSLRGAREGRARVRSRTARVWAGLRPSARGARMARVN